MSFGIVRRKIVWSKEFDSSHLLSLPYESKCLRVHGHTYRVEVEIGGELNENGMIFDFNHLSSLIKRLDHRLIVSGEWVRLEGEKAVVEVNGKRIEIPADEVVVMDKPNVTAEYLAEWIGERIAEKAGKNVGYITVRVWEDPRSYAEVRLEGLQR